jgi:hypothetical protein
MATGAEVFIRKLTLELDELANKYNKTKDPGLRNQWYKKLKQVPPASVLEEALLPSRQENLGYKFKLSQ